MGAAHARGLNLDLAPVQPAPFSPPSPPFSTPLPSNVADGKGLPFRQIARYFAFRAKQRGGDLSVTPVLRKSAACTIRREISKATRSQDKLVRSVCVLAAHVANTELECKTESNRGVALKPSVDTLGTVFANPSAGQSIVDDIVHNHPIKLARLGKGGLAVMAGVDRAYRSRAVARGVRAFCRVDENDLLFLTAGTYDLAAAVGRPAGGGLRWPGIGLCFCGRWGWRRRRRGGGPGVGGCDKNHPGCVGRPDGRPGHPARPEGGRLLAQRYGHGSLGGAFSGPLGRHGDGRRRVHRQILRVCPGYCHRPPASFLSPPASRLPAPLARRFCLPPNAYHFPL